MDATVKLIQIVRAALIFSIALYLLVGEQLAHRKIPAPDPVLYFALTGVAISTVVAIAVLRRVLVQRSERLLIKEPTNPAAMMRWRAGYIFTYALSESVALCGLVLRILGFDLIQILPFYAVALILMMFFNPRRPATEMG